MYTICIIIISYFELNMLITIYTEPFYCRTKYITYMYIYILEHTHTHTRARARDLLYKRDYTKFYYRCRNK